MTDYPDWQSYPIWRGPDFFASQFWALSAANPATAQGTMTNFASLAVNIIPSNPGGALCLVKFFTDASQAIETIGYAFAIPNGAAMEVLIPASGNFMTFSLTTPDAAASGATITVYPTNSPTSKLSYDTLGNTVQAHNQSVPASSTFTAMLPDIAQGPGFIYIADLLTTGHLTGRLVTVNQDGTTKAWLISWNTIGPLQAQTFVSGGHHLRLEVDNTDAAAAHNVSFYVSVDGR